MREALMLMIILFTLFALQLIFQVPPSERASLMLNKEEYKSGEIMDITLEYFSPKNVENVEIYIFAIRKGDHYYLSIRDVRNLTMGLNQLNYTLRMPYCSRCSGISEGEKEIAFEMLGENGEVLARGNKTFMLKA
ncbi:hypothetical protein DRN62_03815 [Nanoarchaeota archaeon]|nr:MAG: hypothetical protein DRN62_03815 [Nanoarchaeota archaeon]